MNWLVEPLQYTFMTNGLLAAVLVGITCAMLGVHVVLRRMAFLGDALAHCVLPGLVVAYFKRWNLVGGALIAGVITALGIGYVSRRETLREDTAIGIFFTGMFALGIVLMSLGGSFRDLSHMLFGNILGVTSSDLQYIAVITVLVLGLLWLFHRELELTALDPLYAQSIGLSPDTLRYGFLVLLALTVVAGMQAVGVVLTSALLVTPAATASLLTDRLPRMMLLAALLAVLSAVVGLYVSFYTNVSSGAAIVLACALCFALTWILQGLRQRHPSAV
jgi:manganese/iron transport system permease protein